MRLSHTTRHTNTRTYTCHTSHPTYTWTTHTPHINHAHAIEYKLMRNQTFLEYCWSLSLWTFRSKTALSCWEILFGCFFFENNDPIVSRLVQEAKRNDRSVRGDCVGREGKGLAAAGTLFWAQWIIVDGYCASCRFYRGAWWRCWEAFHANGRPPTGCAKSSSFGYWSYSKSRNLCSNKSRAVSPANSKLLLGSEHSKKSKYVRCGVVWYGVCCGVCCAVWWCGCVCVVVWCACVVRCGGMCVSQLCPLCC